MDTTTTTNISFEISVLQNFEGVGTYYHHHVDLEIFSSQFLALINREDFDPERFDDKLVEFFQEELEKRALTNGLKYQNAHLGHGLQFFYGNTWCAVSVQVLEVPLVRQHPVDWFFYHKDNGRYQQILVPENTTIYYDGSIQINIGSRTVLVNNPHRRGSSPRHNVGDWPYILLASPEVLSIVAQLEEILCRDYWVPDSWRKTELRDARDINPLTGLIRGGGFAKTLAHQVADQITKARESLISAIYGK